MALGLGSLMGGAGMSLQQSSSSKGGVSRGGSQSTGGTSIDVSGGSSTDAGELLQIAQMPTANGGAGMNADQTSFSQPFSSGGWRSATGGGGISTSTLAIAGGFGLMAILLLRR